MAKQRRKNYPSTTLPIEIISHDILARLPLKSLLTCRLVSKLWRFAIDEPSFANVHAQKYHKNKDKSRYLVLEGYNMSYTKMICSIRNTLKFKRMSSLDIHLNWLRRYQPVGYINGVFCLKKYTLRIQPSNILLWNPSLKKALEVGFPQIANVVHSKNFDIDCAFGYDHVKNDYKVVTSVYIIEAETKIGGYGNPQARTSIKPQAWDHTPAFVQVFTLSTFSWKDATIGMVPRGLWCKNLAIKKVFLNGFIYWGGADPTKMIDYGKVTHFLSFDVVGEVFNYIELPAYEHSDILAQDRFPIVLDQSVGLMETLENYTHIWIMKEEKGIRQPLWNKQYTINLQFLNKCLHFNINGEILFTSEIGWVKSYNVKSEETKLLHKSFKSNPYFICEYMESLVLLTGLPPRTFLIKFPPPPIN